MLYLVVVIYLYSTARIELEARKPSGKTQQEVWRLECELGVISDTDCPVDGGWTPWSPWSPCCGTCNDVGHRRRIRQCINPPPTQDGFPCTGPDNQIEPCYIVNCTTQDYRKIVEGDAIRTEALHQLETVPALMESCLKLECPFEAIQVALANENTWQINPEALWNSLQCVKRNLGCPVVGEWGAWGTWSSCGARCGYGYRWRLRRCDSPPPSNAHFMCTGSPLQADECQGEQCAINKRDSTGTWGEWGNWSQCSEKCGVGVRRRKRNCYEMTTPRLFGSWGTHCRGQHDQLEVCENGACNLDGGWSGWGPWGPCSQTCGAGRRSRSRSCTRPVPAGNGEPCIGFCTEVGTCHLNPCNVPSHTVAVFGGDSYLQYDFDKKQSTLFHFYVRFLPLSPHGIIVRRGPVLNPLVRLSLQKWHVCLDANGQSSSCTVPRICSHSAVEPAVWHSCLISVTSKAVTMRLDDEPVAIRSTFSCDPDLPDEKMNIIVGERFHGEIQEIILNFIPLNMMLNRNTKCNFCPTSGYNVAYETAGIEEAFLNIDNNQFMRLPCFENQTNWRIQITLKPKTDTGSVFFLHDAVPKNWIAVYLQNKRVKLKLALENSRTESRSSTEFQPDEWLDIKMTKKQETNAIEVSVNAGELLHVLFEENPMLKKRHTSKPTADVKNTIWVLCRDEYYVGGVPNDIKDKVPEDLTPFTGVIASIDVNNEPLELRNYPLERFQDGKVQVSARTASVSGFYHETAWGPSNRLNLTCLHTRVATTSSVAHWLYLDVLVAGALNNKVVRSIDDGKVLKLVASANNDLRGFYTCRAHSNKRTRNVVTYGVLGKVQHKLTGPDLTTAIAVITTLALVLGTLLWLIVEGIHDIRDGYGFYRDAHLSPKEEAEAVCKFIDQNINIVGANAAKLAKAKARRLGEHLASRSSFAAQEPQGMMEEEENQASESLGSKEDLDELPALPEIKSNMEHSRTFICEPSYVSSPRHGSVPSPRTRLSSSSSFDTSPRALCSRFLSSKRLRSQRESLFHKKESQGHVKSRSLLTIKSSAFVNPSTAVKILQKFQMLKSEDTDN